MDKNEKYHWGEGCEALKLTDTSELSVIREWMPPGTSEKLHYHEKSSQVFYILNGHATFVLNDIEYVRTTNEFILIEPHVRHKITNSGKDTLEFIVISQPRSHGDRTDLE